MSSCTVAVALVVCLATAGCGRDGPGATGRGARLDRAGLGHAATTICARTARDVAALPRPSDPARSVPYLRRLAAAGRVQLRELRTLRPDDAVAADWRAFLTRLTASYVLVDRLASSAGPEAAAAAIRALTSRRTALVRAADRVGARGCVA